MPSSATFTSLAYSASVTLIYFSMNSFRFFINFSLFKLDADLIVQIVAVIFYVIAHFCFQLRIQNFHCNRYLLAYETMHKHQRTTLIALMSQFFSFLSVRKVWIFFCLLAILYELKCTHSNHIHTTMYAAISNGNRKNEKRTQCVRARIYLYIAMLL